MLILSSRIHALDIVLFLSGFRESGHTFCAVFLNETVPQYYASSLGSYTVVLIQEKEAMHKLRSPVLVNREIALRLLNSPSAVMLAISSSMRF